MRISLPASALAFGLTLGLIGFASPCWGESESLALSLSPSAPGGSISLYVVLSSISGANPAALEWTLSFFHSDIVSVSGTAGPAASAAGKSVVCSGNTCVLYGADAQPVPNGVAAIITLQLSGNPQSSVPVQLASTLGASTSANPVGVSSANGAISVITQPLVFPSNVSSGLGYGGSLTHLASGGTWDTTFNLVNTGPTQADARLYFLADNGGPLSMPVTFPLSSTPTAALSASQLDQTLPPYGMALADSTGPDLAPTEVGSAQLYKDASVSGFVRYRSDLTQQEAIVPLEKRAASAYVLPFDNTNGTVTGVAVANVGSTALNIPVTVRDDTGNSLGVTTLPITGSAHTAFLLANQFNVTAGASGTIEFDTPAGGLISVLGIRYPASGYFTTIPVSASSDPGNGSLAHLAVGGGWETTIELVNMGSTPAQANLLFFDDYGNPLNLPLTVAGLTNTAAALSPSLAPNATVTVLSANPSSPTVQTGSAQLVSAAGQVSGFIRYTYDPSGGEAIVPLETRNAASYFLAYDNTAGTATGVALANVSPSVANIVVTTRDANGDVLGSHVVSVSPNGHSSFVLTDNFSETSNLNGTVEFDTPSGGQISVLGIRYPSTGLYTEIPVVTP